MRRKQILVVALLLFFVAVGMFFIGRTSDTPPAVNIASVTNRPGGGASIHFAISNQTTRGYQFFALPQILSNDVWWISVEDRRQYGATHWLHARTNYQYVVYLDEDVAVMRLQVTCRRNRAGWPGVIESLWRQILPYRRQSPLRWQEAVSSPVNIPPH